MSVEVPIPGGTATLLLDGELTPRRRRPIEKADMQNGPLFARIRNARRIKNPDLSDADQNLGLWGPDLVLSDADAELLTSYSDKKIIARLSAWTLDLPLPTTVDALLDIPGDVYDALAVGVAEAEKASKGNQFELSEQNLENPESPTGASAA